MIFRNRERIEGFARSLRVHFRNSTRGESHFTYGINIAHAWLYMHSLRITIPIQTNRIARKSIHRSVHLDMCAAHASLMHKNAPDTHSLPCDVGTSFHHVKLTTENNDRHLAIICKSNLYVLTNNTINECMKT